MTRGQVRTVTPDWSLWRDGAISGDADHPGEQDQQVAGRTDAVLHRVGPLLEHGDVALVSHCHPLNVRSAR
jgi:probable phosphoglycerate mutase